MKQHPTPEQLHKEAAPVIRDLVKIQVQHYGVISVDSLIYAMVRHLALTVAAVCENGDDYREWIGSLMDQFRSELEHHPEATT